MKKQLRASFILILAATILVSSSGLTLFKMVCLKSGKSQISLFEFKNCCAKESSLAGYKKKCCSYSKQTYQVSCLQKAELKKPISDNGLVLPTLIFKNSWIPEVGISPIGCNISPHSHGREILLFHSVLLI